MTKVIMANVTYGKSIMANVIMAKIIMTKILWQMKQPLWVDMVSNSGRVCRVQSFLRKTVQSK